MVLATAACLPEAVKLAVLLHHVPHILLCVALDSIHTPVTQFYMHESLHRVIRRSQKIVIALLTIRYKGVIVQSAPYPLHTKMTSGCTIIPSRMTCLHCLYSVQNQNSVRPTSSHSDQNQSHFNVLAA